MPDGEKIQHPSYGMIQVSRFSGQSNFFGSSIQHGGGISITIYEGELERGLNHDWHYSRKEHVRVEMSYTQFAEMITAGMNTSGVPCTIKRLNGKGFESPPFINKRTQFQNEFTESMKEQASRLDNLQARIDELVEKKGAVSKKELHEVKDMVYKAHQDLNDNMPYMAKCWNEQLEKTTTEAKGEIEGFVEHKVHEIGVEHLRDLADVRMLEGKKDV